MVDDEIPDEFLEFFNEVIDKHSERTYKKACEGQKEHGGNIRRKAMLPRAMEENQDLTMYLGTLEAQHRKICDLLRRCHAALVISDKDPNVGWVHPFVRERLEYIWTLLEKGFEDDQDQG